MNQISPLDRLAADFKAAFETIDNSIAKSLADMQARAFRFPVGSEEREAALAEWAAADTAENRRIIRERRAVGNIDNGENEYDGDGGREQADHLADNGGRL